MTTLFSKIQSKKAFLWDFDGCFCDSEHVHLQAYSKAFAHFGHTVNSEEYFHTFTHTGAGAAKEIEKYSLSCTKEEIRKLKDEYYWELIQQGQALIFPEIPKILHELQKLGIKSVIASNSRAEEINLILSQMPEKVELDFVVGIEPGMHKKPSPDIYNKALAMLNIKPHEAMVLEDSERGLQAGYSAGCNAIWINTPVSEKFESRAPYLAKITHAELLKLLQTGI
jgi:HAD superfamily hydrolase (TIGR01509 family)